MAELSPASGNPRPATRRLIRISETFEPLLPEILARFGDCRPTRLSGEYHVIDGPDGDFVAHSAAVFCRWNLPLHHSWPCHPEKMDDFIEKAAQALSRKFGDASIQNLWVGALDAGGPQRYYRLLAANLRGRALQLFPSLAGAPREAESQDPDRPSLFCLVGKEGLFCGVSTPREANGFFPGGTKYIKQSAGISRAGAKIAEALHYLKLHRTDSERLGRWLELGASPGGMTSELLRRGKEVTAIDRAPLDRRLDGAERLRFVQADVASFRPQESASFDAILSDMNGPASEAMAHVARLSASLKAGGIVIFTLKTPGAATVSGMEDLRGQTVRKAKEAGLRLFAQTHLTYNRLEFTLFFEKTGQ